MTISDSLDIRTIEKMFMLGAKHGFAKSVDCSAQSVDPCFALAIHELTHDCGIAGMMRGTRLPATWPALLL